MVILFDQYNLPEDLFAIIFATDQQVAVAKLLMAEMKKSDGVFDKSKMSEFAMKLHDGVHIQVPVTVGLVKRATTQEISYNKRQFYDRILTPMKSMGLIEYDLYKKVYRLSDKFARSMENIGKMWAKETQTSSGQ